MLWSAATRSEVLHFIQDKLGAAAGPDRPSAAHIEVPRVEYEKLSDDRLGEPSSTVRARVEAARARQAARFAGTRMLANADLGSAEVRDPSSSIINTQGC
jgi:hypothetical protein